MIVPKITKNDDGWCAVDRAGRPLPGCTPCETPDEAEKQYYEQQKQQAAATPPETTEG